jgi:FAD/FMN-containing dehydrogenase
MFNRREFLKAAGLLALWPRGALADSLQPPSRLVNDIHSQLNPTSIDRLVAPDSLAAIQEIITSARRERKAISIAGGRHAMGAQQFGTGTILIDTRKLNRVLSFEEETGIIEVEAGIQWPELIQSYMQRQGALRQWGIAQKQTGADRLTIGGTLAANAHGRGLTMKPFINNVESFTLMDASGGLRTCSRTQNRDLFRLAIGGYGLFGVVYSIRLRLKPRQKLERVVELIGVEELVPAFERRIQEGYLYGDCQFSIDERSEDFLRRGVFSCYRPVDAATPMPEEQKELSAEDWRDLFYLAHADEKQAFERYSSYYLSTSGQLYWSDTHQLSVYLDDYHRTLDRELKSPNRGSEIITEIYVPRAELAGFLTEAGEDFRQHSVQVIYGTIRLIERDDESFLAWAREAYACVIFNLHTEHTPLGIQHSAQAFRRLIDMAIRRDGSYYLTYHKYAQREQVLACYPQFADLLRAKRSYDSEERFQSDWYRHYRKMFADIL